jgi:hypothetical protein
MAERIVGRPWTPAEDRLLVGAVAVHGEADNWKAVAQCVLGRTNKACRKASINFTLPNSIIQMHSPIALASFPISEREEISLDSRGRSFAFGALQCSFNKVGCNRATYSWSHRRRLFEALSRSSQPLSQT